MDTLAQAHAPARPPLLEALLARRLTWFPEAGYGYFPVRHANATYDRRYFEKYEAYADTEMGRQLTDARLALVARHYSGDLLDVGIGAGTFVAAREHTWGFDINPAGISWLMRRDLWWDPHAQACEAISAWDVLEHIADFPALLERASGFAFVSMPVFDGPDAVLTSKHFRKDEHFWYFTAPGFLRLMRGLGWDCLEENHIESELGRDGIASFAFRRRPA